MTHPTEPGRDGAHPGGPAPGGHGGPPPAGWYPPGYAAAGYPGAEQPRYGYVESLTFPAAVRSAFDGYATFSGRARRSEFWWFFLFQVAVAGVSVVVDELLGSEVTGWLVTIGLFLPALAVGARRLHDTGRSGWWQLLLLVPFIGFVALVVLWAQDGGAEPNRFGASPKYQLVGP